MKTRLTYEEKKLQTFKDIINKMFEIAGHSLTYGDVVGRTDNWYEQYTMTEEQCNQWMEWSKKYLMKKLKLTAEGAGKQMGWVNLSYGLKISQK